MLYGFFDEGSVTKDKRRVMEAFAPWTSDAGFEGSLIYTLDGGQAFRVVRSFLSGCTTGLEAHPSGQDVTSSYRSASYGRLYFADEQGSLSETDRTILAALTQHSIAIRQLVVGANGETDLPQGVEPLDDPKGLLRERFDAQPGTYYLFRPDQHVTGRWRSLDEQKVLDALNRATGNN